MAFTPTFADLARNSASVSGNGTLSLGAAASGFADIASLLSAGDQFYYTLQNLDRPDEHEVGRGTLLADGTVTREPVGGAAPTSFGAGSKTIALVAAAEWHAKVENAATPATAAAVHEGSEASRFTSPAALYGASAPVPLSWSRTVVPDFGAGINFDLVVAGDTLIGGPLGAKPGQSGRLRLTQDSAGGHAIDFAPVWQFAGAVPEVSTGAHDSDVVAYFVAADGAIEATAAKQLLAKPPLLAVSDFKNNYHAAGGEVLTFDDLWFEDLRYGPFIAGSVIEGTGWVTESLTTTPNNLSATPLLKQRLGALAGGYTMVADYVLDQPSGTKPRIVIEISDFDTWNEGWGFYQNGSTHITLYDQASLFDQELPGPTGESRVAVTLAPPALAMARNGGPTRIAAGTPQANSGAIDLGIACYTSHDSTGTPARAVLKRLSFYAPVDPSMLPLMSRI